VVKWLLKASPVLRDIGITGTGLAIVWSQLLAWALAQRTPSDVLLAVGLGLLTPSATVAVRTVLGAGTGGAGSSSPSSSSPPSPPSPPSSLPEGAAGE
jgi:hypothetical protein